MADGGTSARSDLVGGAAWIAFGLAIIAASLRMDRFESMGATLYTMPGFVPGLFGGVLVLLGAALAWRGWRRGARPGRRAPSSSTAPISGSAAPSAAPSTSAIATDDTGRVFNRRVTVVLALSLLYAAVLVGRVPFWLATGLFMVAFVWIFAPGESTSPRRALVAVAAGVLTTALVVTVFEQVFLVRLP